MRIERFWLCGICFKIQGDVGPLTTYTNRQQGKVAYAKDSIRHEPTPARLRQRAYFDYAATHWRALTQDERDRWERITKRLSLPLTGFNLFTSQVTRPDPHALRTVCRHSGIFVPQPPSVFDAGGPGTNPLLPYPPTPLDA